MSHPHRKRPFGPAQQLGRNDGQPDVWDAGARKDLWREARRLYQRIYHEPVSHRFLVIACD